MIIEQVISNIKSVGVFAVVLSILIIVHEWGHFITARKAGIGVERFALGFGPVLFSKFHKGTEFMLCLIPLGGYVKMKGDERSECTGNPEEFFSQPPGKRALVILNGPIVNFIFAYLCLVCVFMLGYPGGTTRITKLEVGGPAQKAGLMVGDRIVEVDSKQVYGFNNLTTRLEGKESSVNIGVERNGVKIDVRLDSNVKVEKNILGKNRSIRDIGISLLSNKIGVGGEKFPAYKFGLRDGDHIVEIESKRIYDWNDIYDSISQSKGESINIVYLRDEVENTIDVIPDIKSYEDENGEMKERRLIGIAPMRDIELFKYNPLQSVMFGFEELIYITVTTYKSLYSMVTGAISAKDSVTGPIGIFAVVKEAARMGISHLLFILGIISASLAIFNLLPIVPLDGGHLFLLGIEKARGKPLSDKVDEYIARVGFSLIILLALFVFYSDFARIGLIDYIANVFRNLFSIF